MILNAYFKCLTVFFIRKETCQRNVLSILKILNLMVFNSKYSTKLFIYILKNKFTV